MNKQEIVEKFSELSVLVIGDAMLDVYTYGTSTRVAQDSSAPVVDVHYSQSYPGGAGNVAANVRSMGVRGRLCLMIGDDVGVETYIKEFGKTNLPAFFTNLRRSTLTKSHIYSNGQLVTRIDSGDVGPMSKTDEKVFIDLIKDFWKSSDVVIISDYDYGIVTESLVAEIDELHREHPKTLVIDSKRPQYFYGLKSTAFKLSYATALSLLDNRVSELERSDRIQMWSSRILSEIGADLAVVTMDTDGSMVLKGRRLPEQVSSNPSKVVCTVGAGDTFAAVLAMALAVGSNPIQATEIATAAAEVVIAKPGTAICTREELKNRCLLK
jgi:D-beta-D-heptose 7-phosphate kinase / D-beta-D-heptose 1-phosphate adenosyltransferase